MNNETVASYVLRLGAVFAFLYPAIDSLFNPYSWVDFIPKFVTSIVPAVTFLDLFAVVEIIIALWILSGRRIFIPCIAATLILLGIVAFNLSEFELLFRDLVIAGLTLSLALTHRLARFPKNSHSS